MLQRDEVSRTARLVAACRALDAERPPGERIIARPDGFARELAGPEPLELAARLPALVTGIALRTRWLDDQLADFAAAHPGGQVVLLGAGLDTRALRLDLPLRFFEIDLPGMLEFKGAAAGGVLVPVDLRVERFADALARGGIFTVGAPTAVVWEGVSYYLPHAAVTATFDQARSVLPAGGTLLCDYVKQSWLDAVQRAGVGGVVAQVAAWREPMISGLADAGATLAEHGFALERDLGIDDLARIYGQPPPADRWYAGRMIAARRT